MNELGFLLLKSSIAFALLLLFYVLFLRKETFHYVKRMVLLSIPVVSISVLFMQFTVKSNSLQPVVEAISILPKTTTLQQMYVSEMDWKQLVLIGSLLISLGILFFTLYHLQSILSYINHSSKQKLETGIVCKTNKPTAPFSFFQYIVLHPPFHTLEEQAYIIEHEQVHVRQKHYIELLVLQWMCILFWWNPLVWIYRLFVIENLEYIVDYEVLQNKTVDKRAYQYSIVNASMPSSLVFVNHFNQSLIKNRIKMMNQQLSNPKTMWKAMMMLPIFLCLIISISMVSNVVAQEVDPINETEAPLPPPLPPSPPAVDSIPMPPSHPIPALKLAQLMSNNNEDYHIILDGKKISHSVFETIDPNTIKSISMITTPEKKQIEMISKPATSNEETTLIVNGKEPIVLDNKALEHSTITLDDRIEADVIIAKLGQEEEATFIVNGKEVTKEEIKAMNPDEIKTIRIINETYEDFGSTESNESEVIITLDGEEISREELNDIDASEIQSIDVRKQEGGDKILIVKKQEEEVLDFAERMPEYPGGINELRKEVQKNYRIPEYFEGRSMLVARFVVNELGQVENVQLLKSHPECDECNDEAIRVLQSIKHSFVPGTKDGKPVKVWYTLPIVIVSE